MNSAVARYAGLIIAPVAWAASTQFGQILPYGDCNSGAHSTASVALTAAALAAGAGLLSWRQKSRAIARTQQASAYVATFLSFILAFALILQGAASLLLSPCLH